MDTDPFLTASHPRDQSPDLSDSIRYLDVEQVTAALALLSHDPQGLHRLVRAVQTVVCVALHQAGRQNSTVDIQQQTLSIIRLVLDACEQLLSKEQSQRLILIVFSELAVSRTLASRTDFIQLFSGRLDPATPALSTDPTLGLSSSWAPIHWVVCADSPLLLQELLTQGANPCQRTQSVRPNQNRLSPLELAASRGSPQCLQELLHDPRVRAQANTRSEHSTNALHLAIYAGRVECARLLLAHCDSLAVSIKGETPLGIAARLGDTAMVQMLLEAGLDPNALDREQEPPLVKAAEAGQLECIELLLPVCNPHLVGRRRTGALFIAAQHGHVHCMPALLPTLDAEQLFANGQIDNMSFFILRSLTDRQWQAVDLLCEALAGTVLSVGLDTLSNYPQLSRAFARTERLALGTDLAAQPTARSPGEAVEPGSPRKGVSRL